MWFNIEREEKTKRVTCCIWLVCRVLTQLFISFFLRRFFFTPLRVLFLSFFIAVCSYRVRVRAPNSIKSKLKKKTEKKSNFCLRNERTTSKWRTHTIRWLKKNIINSSYRFPISGTKNKIRSSHPNGQTSKRRRTIFRRLTRFVLTRRRCSGNKQTWMRQRQISQCCHWN